MPQEEKKLQNKFLWIMRSNKYKHEKTTFPYEPIEFL